MKPLRVPQTTLRLLQRCNHSSCNRGRTNTAFFPQNSNSQNTPKTTDWQGFSLFVLCSVDNCNVAFDSYLFLQSWKIAKAPSDLFCSAFFIKANVPYSFFVSPKSGTFRKVLPVPFGVVQNIHSSFIPSVTPSISPSERCRTTSPEGKLVRHPIFH